MSPTEDELRSALSDGAGDVPDVDHIVFVAKEQRGQRRKRVLSVAAAVVLVGALGTGGTFLVRGASTTETAGGNNEQVTHGAADPAAAASKSSSAASAASRSTAARGTAASGIGGGGTACPAQLSTTALPGGGGTTQFGSSDPLFTKPVDTVTVCAYLAGDTSGSAQRIRLTGSDATAFADSLENATRRRSNQVCPDYRRADQKSLEIFAATADGTQLRTVTTTINEPACAVVVTNGTAVRYGWSWPTSLAPELARLGADATASTNSTGTPSH